MKANELMIGDWVNLSKGNWSENKKVELIDIEMVAEGVYLAEPIPLTTEILEKNGFVLESYSGNVMSGKWWTREDFCIHKSMNDSVGRNNFKYEYVHQLQHALRLSGIEKEIIL